MATNETARAAAFASQADKSRELAAGYVPQMIALSRAVRDMRDSTVQAINTMQIPHRWMGTRLELMVDGQWLGGPDLGGTDGRGIKSVAVSGGRLIVTFDDDEIADIGSVLGDVIGPTSSTDGHLALYDGDTGKTIKDSGKSLADFATAVQGEKADSAVQPDDLGTAALESATAFATAAQGNKADSAVQPTDIGATVQGYSSVLAATTASFTAEHKSKLDGVEAGATANDTDANLKNRANHTGLQAISTVSGLQTTLDGKATAAQGNKADSAVQPTDIGVSVQPFDADTAKTDVAQQFTKPQRVAIVSLVDAATITPNLNDGNDFMVTLGANRIIANPTNMAAAIGQEVMFTFRGAFQPSFGTYFKFSGGVVPTFSGSLNAVGGKVISATEILAFAGTGMA